MDNKGYQVFDDDVDDGQTLESTSMQDQSGEKVGSPSSQFSPLDNVIKVEVDVDNDDDLSESGDEGVSYAESGQSILEETGYDSLTSGRMTDTDRHEDGDVDADDAVPGLSGNLKDDWSEQPSIIKMEPVNDNDQDYCDPPREEDQANRSLCKTELSLQGLVVKSEDSFASDPSLKMSVGCSSGNFNGLTNASLVAEVMGDKRFTCTFCDKSFKGNSSLIKHMRIHTGEKPFPCNVCSKSFAQKSNLKTHLKIHSGEKPHVCDVCDKGFISLSDLTQHTSIHTGQKRFQCPEANCDRGFNTKYKLKIHIRFHTGERPYNCSVCGKNFTRPYDLKIHFRTHTEEKNHGCSTCFKRFKRNTELTAHIRTHTGEKPYTCTVCLRSFAESGSLANHRRIHTGEMPYSCGLCSKEFHHSSNLKRHMKCHIGDKPFQCPVCQRCFCTTSDLKRHSEIHQDDRSKRFKCSVCDRGFRRSDHLKKHMKLHLLEKEKQTEKHYDEGSVVVVADIDCGSMLLPTAEDVRTIVGAVVSCDENSEVGHFDPAVEQFSVNSFHDGQRSVNAVKMEYL